MKVEDKKAFCSSFRKATKIVRSLYWPSPLITVNLGGVWVSVRNMIVSTRLYLDLSTPRVNGLEPIPIGIENGLLAWQVL